MCHSKLVYSTNSSRTFKLSVFGGIWIILALAITWLLYSLYYGSGSALIAAVLFGPLSVWLLLASAFGVVLFWHSHPGEKQLLRYFFPLSLVSGILAITIAIGINNESTLLASAFFELVSGFVPYDRAMLGTYLLLFAVLGPLSEELAKALPLFLLYRTVLKRRKHSGEVEYHRIIRSRAFPVFIGLISGLTFGVLETYFYMWKGPVILVASEIGTRYFFQQLAVRSTFPLHAATTSLVGLGVYHSLYGQRTTAPIGGRAYGLWFSYLAAVILHGFWNGTLVYAYFAKLPDITIFQLPAMTLTVGLVADLVILTALLVSIRRSPSCPVCLGEHTGSHLSSIASMKKVSEPLVDILDQAWQCPVCSDKTRFNGQFCEACGAAVVYSCPKCMSPVSIYADKCWFCSQLLDPVSGKMDHIETPRVEMVSSALAAVFIALTAGQSIALLILFFRLNLSIESLGTLMIIIISTAALLVSVQWYVSPEQRVKGIIVLRSAAISLIVELLVVIVAMTLFLVISIFTSATWAVWIYLLPLIVPLGTMVVLFFVLRSLIEETNFVVDQLGGEST